jgi:hypothetical protein
MLSSPGKKPEDESPPSSPMQPNHKDHSGEESPEEIGSAFKIQPKNTSEKVESYQRINIVKNNQRKAESKIVRETMFLPHFDGSKPSQNHLFYGPSNIFMFIKFFFAIYERVLKARDLILEKINQDLSEMSSTEKVKAGIINPDTGALNQEVAQIFLDERYEHLLKGIFATTTSQVYSGPIVTASGGGSGNFYYNNHILMDHNKYEDYARILLGKNAFLLFQIDKIVAQTVKQLQSMHSDHSC